VEYKYGTSDFERRHYALLALMCIYGIELLHDNIAELPREPCWRSSRNILAWTPRMNSIARRRGPRSEPRTWRRAGNAHPRRRAITFAEWGISAGAGSSARLPARHPSRVVTCSAPKARSRARLGKHEISSR
jgi:hypothetical protein